MKKKIALLLAAVMTVGSLPMTAFASTTNTVSAIKTVEDGDAIEAKVFLDEFKGIGATDKKQTVRLRLTNAKFTDANYGTTGGSTTGSVADAQKAYDDAVNALGSTDKDKVKKAETAYKQAEADLKAALGVDGTELKEKMESAKAEYDKAVEELTAIKGNGTDIKGTLPKAQEDLKLMTDLRDAQLKVDGSAGELQTKYASALTNLVDSTDLELINVYFNVNGTKASPLSGISNAAGLSLFSGKAADGSTDILDASKSNYVFWVDYETETDVTGDKKDKVDGIITELNNILAELRKADGYVIDAAATVKELTTEQNNAQAKVDSTKTAYTEALGNYNEIAADVKDAQAKVDSTKSTYLTTLASYPAVLDAYTKLVAAQNGSSSSEGSTSTISGDVKYTKISDTEYMAEFDAHDDCSPIALEIFAEADGSGDASVTIESVDSVVSSQTLKIANIADGATTTTISGTTSIKEKGSKIKNVVITETTAGSIEAGTMKLRLTNGFEFTQTPSVSDIVVFPENGGTNGTLKVTGVTRDNDNQDLLITFTGSSTTASTISVGNLYVGYDEDDVEVGDECEITVSDAGTTKQSIVVGKASDYTVSFTAEDKDLPTFYAGTYSEDTDSLVVTLKEELEDAWITGRSTKIVFPEGVEVVEVNVEDKGNTDAQDATNSSASNIKVDENEVDLGGVEVNNGKKAELELSFTLSVSPEFTGDIEATLTGSGIGDDQTVVVGTAAAPVKVEADINELPIDYRKTEASDIVITEAAAGVLKKDTTVRLAIDGIAFDGDPTVEVESGDLKIENVKIKDEYLTFDVKTESQKEAAVIRISDVNLNMNRSLPAGDYDLLFTTSGDETNGEVTSESKLSKNAIIRNYNNDSKVEQGTFDVDEITALKGYVTVVTAGRDQDDSTFTTKVSVTIGASTMKAGTKDITLDVPAYISNGYTMMPVRAVTEALSGSAIVRWDDPTNTVTITFGQRVISMTVGSNVMKINGVDVAMQAQCEITDSRAFIPLRDLGYALGLNDSKIAWDDATKTATLN